MKLLILTITSVTFNFFGCGGSKPFLRNDNNFSAIRVRGAVILTIAGTKVPPYLE